MVLEMVELTGQGLVREGADVLDVLGAQRGSAVADAGDDIAVRVDSVRVGHGDHSSVLKAPSSSW
jgi:hypothetical protein